MRSRVVSVLLALCMALALLPGPALAAPGGAGEDPFAVWSWEELPEDQGAAEAGDFMGDFTGDFAGELPEDIQVEDIQEEIQEGGELDDSIPEFIPGIPPAEGELYYPDYELLGDSLGEGLGEGLPRFYDSRGVTQTSTKNQGSNGLCCAFASMAALEAQFIMLGKGKQDFSEAHLSFSLSDHDGKNPQQGRTGRKPSDGVNREMVGAYLMRGTELGGTVEEAADPYYSRFTSRELDISRIKERTWQAQDILYLTGKGRDESSFNMIKRAVMTYGGVGAYILMRGQTTADDGTVQESFYNASTHAYCYNFDKDRGTDADKPKDENGYNHAIEIAGWDDDYSRENFASTARPEKDGAWLIKNSWGTWWGDGGYAWVSYEDTSFPQYAYCFAGARPYDPGEIVYETDFFNAGSASGWSAGTQRYFAKVFTKETGGEEELTAIRIFLATPYASIQVGCVSPVSGETLDGYTFEPLGGSDPAAETFSPGWYTIELEKPVSITGARGSQFAVTVGITAPTTEQGGKGIFLGTDSQNALGDAKMFVSGNGRSWGTSASNYCIKAVTSPVEPQARGQVIVDKAVDSLCWTLIRGENDSQDNVSSKLNLPASFKGADVTWTSSDPSVIKPDGTLTPARFDKTGQVTLTAAVSRDGGTGEKTFHLTVPLREPTAQDYFDAAKEWLSANYTGWWDLIRGENTKAGEIRSNLVVPNSVTIPTETGGTFQVAVTGARPREADENGNLMASWRFVTNRGEVTRPAYGQPDSKGTFFLTLANGSGSASITSRYLTVLAYRGLIKPAPLADVTSPAERDVILRAKAATEGNPGQLQYQWNMSYSADGSDPREIGTAAQLRITTNGAEAQAYFFCEISAPDAAPVRTDIAKVTMIPGYSAAYADGSNSGRVETCNLPLSQAAAVYAARYEDGRMTGIVKADSIGEDEVIFNAAVGRGWKLFCLDGGSAPLCPAPVIQ